MDLLAISMYGAQGNLDVKITKKNTGLMPTLIGFSFFWRLLEAMVLMLYNTSGLFVGNEL